ncbi:MAG: hypothetical protein U5K84_11340 [Alkalibacterium sp.]|nr:hypothetical protein [Alkalibacterium sp.]
MHTYYVGLEQDISEWTPNNAEEVALSRQIERLDRSANQSARVQETLEESAYPMSYITEDLSAVFSSEGEQVTTYPTEERPVRLFLFLKTPLSPRHQASLTISKRAVMSTACSCCAWRTSRRSRISFYLS